MNNASSKDSQPAARRSVHRSRLERRTYRRALRRRQARRKLWLSTAPALVVVVAVAVFLALAGRSEPEGLVPSTVPPQAAKDGLVLVEEGQEVPAAVLLHPAGQGGLALAVPGVSLLCLPSRGFTTIADAHLVGEDDQLGVALGEALSIGIAGVVSVSWSDLKNMGTASAARLGASSTSELSAEGLVQAAEGLVDVLSQEKSREELLGKNPPLLRGQVDEFRKALTDFRFSPREGWATATVTGQSVAGKESAYLEADWGAARAILAGVSKQAEVAVQVQNGCGLLNVVEQIGEFLGSLGFRVLAPANAEGFPSVELSRVRAAPDALPAGARIAGLLSIVNLASDDSLASGEVVVVLGKDFVPPLTVAVEAVD